MRFTLTPTPSNTATPSLTPSNTPSYTPTGTVCPGATPTATKTPIPSLTPTHTPTPSTTPEYSAYCACYEIVITSPAPPEGYAGSIEYYTCGDKVLMGRIFATPGTYYQCGSNDIGFEPIIVDGTGTVTDLGYNCLGGCPVVEPTSTPTQTPTPTSATTYNLIGNADKVGATACDIIGITPDIYLDSVDYAIYLSNGGCFSNGVSTVATIRNSDGTPILGTFYFVWYGTSCSTTTFKSTAGNLTIRPTQC